jgi:hypothetical protein
MSYEEKLEIANDYLRDKVGIEWDDLPDINSLHDCEDIAEIHGACDDRLGEDDFPFEDE